MLQRIQTVYLLLAAGLSAGLIFVFHLWISDGGDTVFAKDNVQ